MEPKVEIVNKQKVHAVHAQPHLRLLIRAHDAVIAIVMHVVESQTARPGRTGFGIRGGQAWRAERTSGRPCSTGRIQTWAWRQGTGRNESRSNPDHSHWRRIVNTGHPRPKPLAASRRPSLRRRGRTTHPTEPHTKAELGDRHPRLSELFEFPDRFHAGDNSLEANRQGSSFSTAF